MSNSSSKNSTLPISNPDRGEEKLFRGSGMTKRGAFAAICYMSCAVLLVLFNKAALSSYNFPSANVITLFQMISSCCFLYALRRSKIIVFITNEPLTNADNSLSLVPIRTLIRTVPLSLAYLLYMLVTMESVRGVNVPMYTTIRRTTVVFTMIVEYILAGQKYTSSVVGSVGLIVLGAFIAGARDLSFDTYGYAVGNLVVLIALALCGAMVVLLLSCILAFFLNYSIFLNTTLNSALTQTICGNLKDLFTIGLGWMIFGGLPFDILNFIGQLLGFFGSGLYAYYKLIGKQKKICAIFVFELYMGAI
ncbi:Sugar phosphate transporter domain [Dillenia turbinata]|uniref:Sugar phosphate transporter domain n=1 Tax=Dillenia turbinata TaxID=194707 RepID=A0AAN8Z7C1_9MAGN